MHEIAKTQVKERPFPWRQCECCGQMFEAKRRDKIFCSKKCKNRDTNRKWRELYPDKVKDGILKWKKANGEKIRETSRKYYIANREIFLENNRKWRKVNSQKVLESARRCRLNNREHRLEMERKRISEKLRSTILVDLQHLQEDLAAIGEHDAK